MANIVCYKRYISAIYCKIDTKRRVCPVFLLFGRLQAFLKWGICCDFACLLTGICRSECNLNTKVCHSE